MTHLVMASIPSALNTLQHDFSTWGKLVCIIMLILGAVGYAVASGLGNSHMGSHGLAVAGKCVFAAILIVSAGSLIAFGSGIVA